MALSRQITAQITDLLKEYPQGLSITDIVKKIDINRNTAGRYLENLLVSGQVEMRHFGMAKIYALSNRMPQSAMLSISSDLVMHLDSSLRIVFANEPFLNMLRVTSADLLGKNIEYSAAVQVFDDALEDFITIVKTGISGKEWQGTLALNKGDRFYSCHVTPLVFGDGRKGVSVRLEDLTELRHREQALQESEARLRSIISAAPVGIGVVSDRVILEVNTLLCQMTGYHASELIGKSARILYTTQEEYDAVGREKYELIARMGAGTVQTQWQKKDGTIIDILLSSAPINSADLTLGVTFTALDITKRTRAEKALQESEERSRKLLEISPDPVILHRDGKIIYANTAAHTLIGSSHPEEMVGKSVLDFIEPGFRDMVKANISKDLDGEFSPHTELQMLRLDGTPVTVEGRGVLTLIDGKPAVLVALRNITGRKLADENLKESERKYRFLAENSLDIINRQTPECILTYVSPVVTPVLGYSEQEVLGRSLLEMVHPDDIERVRQDLMHIISEGLNRVTSSFRFRHREGHFLWFESTTNIIRDPESGKIVELFSISRDITERKAKEDALIASEERYRHLLEQSFDAIIIHKEGKIAVANEAALAIAGVPSSADLIGRSIFDFIHRDSRDLVKTRVAALENTKSETLPLAREKFIRPDGRAVDVEVMATSFTDNGIPAIQVVFREISDNRE